VGLEARTATPGGLVVDRSVTTWGSRSSTEDR
jgi:hypothetical protein